MLGVRWDYDVKVILDKQDWQEELKKMGEWGWELVSVVSHGGKLLYFFKKERQA